MTLYTFVVWFITAAGNPAVEVLADNLNAQQCKVVIAEAHNRGIRASCISKGTILI